MKLLSKSDRTKAFIIESTAGIFNTKGYAGTSLSDITEATRLTKGSVYGNFDNKEEVALAVFDHNLGKVMNTIKVRMAAAVTYKAKLMVYVDVYSHFLQQPFTVGGCPLLNTAVEADDTHPALKAKASDALLYWKKNIEGLIKKAVAAGEFSRADNAQQTALAMIAMIEGAIMIGKVTGKMNYMKIVMRSVEQLIEDMV